MINNSFHQVYRLSAIVTIYILLLPLAACSSDTSSAEITSNAARHEQDTPTGQPDSEPITLSPYEIPAHIELSVDPMRSSYIPGTTISATVSVYNRFGETLDFNDIQYTTEPESLVSPTETPGEWELLNAGELIITACISIDDSVENALCANKKIVIDNNDVAIEIYSPHAGDEIRGQMMNTIDVEGIIHGASANTNVYVNGQQALFDAATGEFSYSIDPHFGINSIEVVAISESGTTETTHHLDVLWAPVYYPLTPGAHPSFSLKDALTIQLGQNFFDNSSPYSHSGTDLIIMHDLEDFLILLIEYLDLNEQIPDPVISSDAFSLRILDTTINSPYLNFIVTDNGLELFVHIDELVATTEGQIVLTDTELDIDGYITVQLSAVASIELNKQSVNSPISVEMTEFELAIENASSHFASAEANAIFDLAESALRLNLEQILFDTIQTSFLDSIPTLLGDVFTTLDSQLANNVIDFALNPDDPLALTFQSHIESLKTSYRNALALTASFAISADKPVLYPQSPGIASMVPIQPPDSFFSGSHVQAGIRMTLINGILHAIWNAGLLEIDVLSFLPDGIEALIQDAVITGKLPPIIAPPRADEPYDLILTLGQLELTFDYGTQQDVYGINVQVGADVVIGQNDVGLILADEPDVQLWVISTTGQRVRQSTNVLRQLMINELWPQIENDIGNSLSFSLPIPSLDGLGTIAPYMPAVNFSLQSARAINIRDGFLIADIALEGEMPMPQPDNTSRQ